MTATAEMLDRYATFIADLVEPEARAWWEAELSKPAGCACGLYPEGYTLPCPYCHVAVTASRSIPAEPKETDESQAVAAEHQARVDAKHEEDRAWQRNVAPAGTSACATTPTCNSTSGPTTDTTAPTCSAPATTSRPKRKRRTKAQMAEVRAKAAERIQNARERAPITLREQDEYEADFMATIRNGDTT